MSNSHIAFSLLGVLMFAFCLVRMAQDDDLFWPLVALLFAAAAASSLFLGLPS